MKILKSVLAAALIIMLFTLSASAESQSMNWFFKSKGNNSQPEILGGSKIPSEYGALYMGSPDDKTIYLTFDAGYSNENLEKTLDVLKEENVKAAFFILPGIIKNSPETVKRMANEGHLVCNHTTSHCNMGKITDLETFKKELTGIENLYKETFGLEMEKYFRPPEGAFSLKTLQFCKQEGYTPVFWSFAYADWDNNSQPNPQKSLDKILSNAHNGMVLLLHPTSKTNAEILKPLITQLRSKGYTFGTLNDLSEKQNKPQ